MDTNYLYDKVLGCLVTAGMGDALGAPSEAMDRDDIKAKFGRIETFVDGSDNRYSLGARLAEITDDTTQIYEMARAVVQCGGKLTVQAAADALVAWSDRYPKFYPNGMGPTTRLVIEELKAGKNPAEIGTASGTYYRGTTNGAAMRVAAAGLVYPGDLQGALENAVAMSMPSHGTQHAFAGAAAIACGIAEALLPSSNLWDIAKACIWGARQGEKRGLETARRAHGISTVSLLLRAVDVAINSTDMFDAEEKIEYQVGNDVSVQASVAAAVGLFLAAGGDAVQTIISGANIGGDTDTIACIAGMLAGAHKGFSSLPTGWWEQFKQANEALDFEDISKKLTAIAAKNLRASKALV